MVKEDAGASNFQRVTGRNSAANLWLQMKSEMYIFAQKLSILKDIVGFPLPNLGLKHLSHKNRAPSVASG